MKENNFFEEDNMIKAYLKYSIILFKWLFLIASVINFGISLSFLLIVIFKDSSSTSQLLINIFALITPVSDVNTINSYLVSKGLIKFSTACVAYGLMQSFKYWLYYTILTKTKIIYDKLVNGPLFTKENMNIIDEIVPLTFYASFIEPVIVYIVSETTGIFENININMVGIFIIAVVFFIKLIFERALTEIKQPKSNRLVDDVKALNEELKMEIISKEAKLKAKVKELNKIKKEIKENVAAKEDEVKKVAKEVKEKAVSKTDEVIESVKEEAKKTRKPRAKKKKETKE